MTTQMVSETSVYSPFNHLKQLLAQENFVEVSNLKNLNCFFSWLDS